jgi:exoribonuclease-2
MYVLFEDGGDLRAGTIRAQTDASLQVDSTTGKRLKVKSNQVLMSFDVPKAEDLLGAAGDAASTIDVDFLWQCAPQEEFAFEDLARDYVGRAPSAIESAAILLCLQSAPVYFQRKGRGKFRPAAPDVLRQALAALERRRLQEAQRDAWIAELVAGRLPADLAAIGPRLVIRPDRNRIEIKAFEAAADRLQVSALRLALRLGAIASAYDWHVGSFIDRAFPSGLGFPGHLTAPGVTTQALAPGPRGVFSIDDSATTEIDDAFSVQEDGSTWLVGIHIAAPAMDIRAADALDQVSRQRLSTVYAPGIKYTMLPPAWIEAFSLAQGRCVPALSLYLRVDPQTVAIVDTFSRIESICVESNLRYDVIEASIDEASLDAGSVPVPHGADLARLWRLANALRAQREKVRGKPEPRGRREISLLLDGEGPDARVSCRVRRRDAPLDRIVAELMICANHHWGAWLEQQGAVGIYRSQSQGRVRMSTVPGPHEGLGVARYAWCTSPLRRYVDLVNQRQLIALVQAQTPPHQRGDADIFAIVSAFDAAYTLYAEFQESMERYWSLKWISQHSVREMTARTARGDILRLEDLPMTVRIAAAETLPRGQRVALELGAIDEVALSIEARICAHLDDTVSDEPSDEDELSVAPPAVGASA